MIAALSACYRTYAIDRNGDIGRITSTRRMANVDDLMTWLDELLTVLSPAGPIHLGGLSYGGWLTAQYALRFPQRLRSIVLVAPEPVEPQLLAQLLELPVAGGPPVPVAGAKEEGSWPAGTYRFLVARRGGSGLDVAPGAYRLRVTARGPDGRPLRTVSRRFTLR